MLKNSYVSLICIVDDGKGFSVITPHSTTFCDDIDDVCDDIEEYLIYYLEVKKHEKQKKR